MGEIKIPKAVMRMVVDWFRTVSSSYGTTSPSHNAEMAGMKLSRF
jgi:hypothetical protein